VRRRAVWPRCYAGAMTTKARPNHALYLRVLRAQTPEQRLAKAFELGEFSRALFREGLRQRFPHLSDDELHRLYLERLEKCHNRIS
jgi:hypothetical protein